jgi:hypothetical protein
MPSRRTAGKPALFGLLCGVLKPSTPQRRHDYDKLPNGVVPYTFLMRFLPQLSAALLIGVLAVGVLAEREASPPDVKADVSGLNLGTYWGGAPLTKSELKGKVVLVELWGS